MQQQQREIREPHVFLSIYLGDRRCGTCWWLVENCEANKKKRPKTVLVLTLRLKIFNKPTNWRAKRTTRNNIPTRNRCSKFNERITKHGRLRYIVLHYVATYFHFSPSVSIFLLWIFAKVSQFVYWMDRETF